MSLYCHWPSGTLFRLTGVNGEYVCGIDTEGGWGVWLLVFGAGILATVYAAVCVASDADDAMGADDRR